MLVSENKAAALRSVEPFEELVLLGSIFSTMGTSHIGLRPQALGRHRQNHLASFEK